MLAAQAALLALPPAPRVLEIGCGTGLLGEALMPRWPDASWLMTDLSPAMLARARARFAGMGRIAYRVMDGAAPDGPVENLFAIRHGPPGSRGRAFSCLPDQFGCFSRLLISPSQALATRSYSSAERTRSAPSSAARLASRTTPRSATTAGG